MEMTRSEILTKNLQSRIGKCLLDEWETESGVRLFTPRWPSFSKAFLDWWSADFMAINSSPPKCCIYASVNWVCIGSDNGLSPVRRQAITWTNANLFSVWPLGTHLGEIPIKIQISTFTKMHLKKSSAKWRPLARGGDEFKLMIMW